MQVVSFWNYPAIPAVSAAVRAGVPYVISPHGSLMHHLCTRPSLTSPRWWRRFAWQNLVNRWTLNHAAAIHFTTNAERDVCLPGIGRTRWFVEPNPVSLPRPVETRRNLIRQEFGLSSSRRLVSHIGRLTRDKAVSTLLRAVAVCATRGVDLELALAHPPHPARERELAGLARKLGISDRVIFLGFVSPRRRTRLLAISDCLPLISQSTENFGYAAAEAMAAGVPVLLSPSVGICRDAVSVNGAIVVGSGANEIACALVKLLTNNEFAKKTALAGQRFAEQNFAAQIVAGRMQGHYHRLSER